MSRNYTKLRAYHPAHALVVAIFRHAHEFPREQRFIVQQQLQRAALSVSCNIVEGCARRSAGEYRQFINIALGSAHETLYLLELSGELCYLPSAVVDECRNHCKAVVGSLQNLMTALEQMESALSR